MDFFEAVSRRRSVRKFKPDSVPREVIVNALDAALLAPNSSNLQAWEFFWVKEKSARASLVEACFSQGAARTAQELVVAVSRLDTWKRNRDLLVGDIKKHGALPKALSDYYTKVIPLAYTTDPIGALAVLKKLVFTAVGFFRPVPRGPNSKSELFEVVTKSAALACENFMLAVAAQGFDSCPMEGFDEYRVKKLLKLKGPCHVVMVLGIGKADPEGISGERFRVPRELVVHEIN